MIELVQHFSIGSRSQQRHHHNEQQRDDERRKQLVNSEDTTKRLDEIMPDQHGRSTGKHARNRTEFIGTTPIQRAEHQRTERSAQTGPCIRNNLENRRILIERNHNAENEHNQQCDARNHHYLTIGGLAIEQSAENILTDRGSADNQV